MGEVLLSTFNSECQNITAQEQTSFGTLEGTSQDYTIFAYKNTQEVSEKAFNKLKEFNEKPPFVNKLSSYTFTPVEHSIDKELNELLYTLSCLDSDNKEHLVNSSHLLKEEGKQENTFLKTSSQFAQAHALSSQKEGSLGKIKDTFQEIKEFSRHFPSIKSPFSRQTGATDDSTRLQAQSVLTSSVKEKTDSKILDNLQKPQSETLHEASLDLLEQRGDQNKREQNPQEGEEEDNIQEVSKVAKVTTNEPGSSSSFFKKKPVIPQPQQTMSLFSCYYLIDKLSLLSEANSFAEAKQEITLTEEEMDHIHKARLEELRKAIKKEKSSERWGVAVKMFSWIASLVSIIGGIALIASGVGAVAGALLVTGGVVTLSNQIFEVTGGWKKIAEILPGEDSDKKRAIISWMQIGITVLCLILAGCGLVFGGFASLGKGMQTAMAVFGGIATIGIGVTNIGAGINQYFYYDSMSQTKNYELKLIKLKHRQKDLIEKTENAPEELESIFEMLARALDFQTELDQAFQSAWT